MESMNNSQNDLEELLKDKKFDALKYKHQDQATLLHNLTNIDLKLFLGYLVAQFFIVSFVVSNQSNFGIIERLGLFIIDIALSLLIINLLERNYIRRLAAKETIKNCDDALGYNDDNIYSKGKKINATPEFNPWYKGFGYKFGIIISIVGVFLILFIPFLIELINKGCIPLYLNK